MDFKPPKILPFKIEWATYIPGRTTSSEFKVHKNRGQALNAINSAPFSKPNAILYHYENDEWVEVFRIENFNNGDMHCVLCKKDIKSKYHGISGYTKWKDNPLQLVKVCYDCRWEWERQKNK